MNEKRITCFGSGAGLPGDPAYDAMATVGQLIARAGYEVVTGAYSGSGMEAPAVGARQAGGRAIGYYVAGFPGSPNKHVEPVNCATMGGTHWRVVEAYGLRLGSLLDSDAFVVGPAPGIGTVVEVAAVVNLNLKYWLGSAAKRCALLQVEGAPTTAIDAAIHSLIGSTPANVQQQFQTFFNAQQAVEWVCASHH